MVQDVLSPPRGVLLSTLIVHWTAHLLLGRRLGRRRGLRMEGSCPMNTSPICSSATGCRPESFALLGAVKYYIMNLFISIARL
ncbi:hypothetical protein C8T65DRAFT_672694 [Cerioporus squamosus]|nr:hypothetical protein C8T65DRAFT_672694 [Cerioporus squamosus]